MGYERSPLFGKVRRVSEQKEEKTVKKYFNVSARFRSPHSWSSVRGANINFLVFAVFFLTDFADKEGLLFVHIVKPF